MPVRLSEQEGPSSHSVHSKVVGKMHPSIVYVLTNWEPGAQRGDVTCSKSHWLPGTWDLSPGLLLLCPRRVGGGGAEPRTQEPFRAWEAWSAAGKVWGFLASYQSLPLTLKNLPLLCQVLRALQMP